MDSEAAARRWIDAWSRGWAASDPDTIASAYAEDAVFRSHPFREPHLGRAGAREYGRHAFEDEETLEFRFGEPLAAAGRAAVEYWAILRSAGKEHTLFGIALLSFDPDGLVAEHRDYWSTQEGRREPPPAWGL
ncbi:MAG: nuclear transport factor 2 family protein [Actinobacteria bacterium]|nr:MAG: nuclear transport factor 2 family protein [Actinomycetota bacterium]